jgi:hypothetical protein
VRAVIRRSITAALVGLILTCAPSASAATYRASSNGFTVTLFNGSKMASLRLPKDQVKQEAYTAWPMWSLYCGRPDVRGTSMFSVADYSGGQRTFRKVTLARRLGKRRHCELWAEQVIDGAVSRTSVAKLTFKRR